MEQTITTLEGYFDREIALCAERQQALGTDGRTDEATFQNIRSNMFDIFRTVLASAKQHCGNDPDAIRAFFQARLAQIPTAWESSLRTAQAHGDVEKAHIEQIKLDAVVEIRNAVATYWGECV